MLPTPFLALLAILLQPAHAQTGPLLGDTSSALAILFSPPFLPQSITSEIYPNYTLPTVQPTFTPPLNPPNYTLLLFPTTYDSPKASNTTSAIALRGVPGAVELPSDGPDASLVQRSEDEGWRTQWIVGGLQPDQNYTAFNVFEANQTVLGPVFLLTKSSSFACTLTHSLPFCPYVSYAVPIMPPSYQPAPQTLTATEQTHTAATLPQNVTEPLLSSLTNFSISLSSFACGRDVYSPLKTCTDCYYAYRDWACAVSLPRCGDPTQSPPSSLPQPAIVPRDNASARDGFGGFLGQNYSELLPCLESCSAVDRSCPYFLQFKCPVRGITAQFSYGVGFIDGVADGAQGQGVPGVPELDGWAWCNAGTNINL